MLNTRTRAAAIGIATASLVTACATTQPIAQWQDSSYTGGPVDNILIIGVSDKETNRRIFEDSFVRELKARNVTAVASAGIMPVDQKISRETIEAAIKGRKIDAVLITRLLGVSEEQSYVPPTYQPMVMPGYGSYYGYYSRAYDYVYEPGYYAKYKVYKLETNLYQASTAKLIWSMQTESVEPKSPQQVIEDQIRIVTENLAKSKLI